MSEFIKYLYEEVRFTCKNLGLMILFLIGIPFLTVWFAGAYYHEYVNDIPIAALDEDNSSLSRKLIQYFDDSERFEIAYYPSSREELQRLIDEKKIAMGLYIPPRLEDDVMALKASEVLILTDGTNVVVGNNAYAGAAEIIQTISAGTEIKIIGAKGSIPKQTANNIALSFNFNDRMLYDTKLTYMNYLIYGFIAVFFQQLLMSGLATLILRNPTETAAENTFVKLAAKTTLAALLLIIAAFIAIFIIRTRFNVVFKGNIFLGAMISLIFAFAISCPAILLCAALKDKIRFSQISYMLSLPTFLTCGYVWPVDQMPQILVWFVKLTWPLIYFARAFDEIMVKGMNLAGIRQSVINLILYIIVFMPLSLWFFKRRFKVKEETNL